MARRLINGCGFGAASLADLRTMASPLASAQLSFEATTVPFNGAFPAGIASDFNGDGHPDLATANEGSLDA